MLTRPTYENYAGGEGIETKVLSCTSLNHKPDAERQLDTTLTIIIIMCSVYIIERERAMPG